jgi:hypothetical protein
VQKEIHKLASWTLFKDLMRLLLYIHVPSIVENIRFKMFDITTHHTVPRR